MYSSIVITNAISCQNKKINYKFSIIFDKINWKTIVSLKIHGREFIKDFSGEFYMTVLSKISSLLNLPHDSNGKVYDGPEIKIRANDTYTSVYWSNATNTMCEYDKAFNIPGLYITPEQQALYNDMVIYLIKLSDIIFREDINKN
jgi:hypothetical protein